MIMTAKEKIKQLQSVIKNQLQPLIKGENVLLTDLPYHENIGDVLIWQGEIDFIKSINKNILDSSSCISFKYPKVSEDVTILLHGGGNFGDLYRFYQDFRLKVIKHYPKNRIIILPQSVSYADLLLAQRDADCLSEHDDLFICARDKDSFEFLSKYFKNNILLVPDMAFCIDDKYLEPYRNKSLKRQLYLKRIDKELAEISPEHIGYDCDILDWPSFENPDLVCKFFQYIRTAANHKLLPQKMPSIIADKLNKLADKQIREKLVHVGIEFISNYSNVTTTRLHAMILAILLYKHIYYIDNTTKKLSSYYSTWLQDLDEVCEFK